MSQEYQRARSAEHKAERFEEIMAAADELFAELPYQEITPTTLGERLGWSRSNLYKYLSTKEEVFLALHTRENESFVTDIATTLAAAEPGRNAFARAWGSCIDRHRKFVRYQAILTTILETNVPFEKLVAFKSRMREVMTPAIDALQARYPERSQGEVVALYLALIYHAVGLRGHYLGTDEQSHAMELAGMGRVTGTFAQANERFALMLLAGFEEER